MSNDIKKRRIFERFCEKGKVINPNLVFEIDDWIPQAIKIKGKCLLHPENKFFVYRTQTGLFTNCSNCKKTYSKEENDIAYNRFKEIDEKYKLLILEDDEKLILAKKKL